jgi:putative two-component system response regulator
VRPIVRFHHELLDGSGYPDGLKGSAVPLLAQIMGVVDVFDALTSERPYRTAVSADAAHEELVVEAKRGWRDRELIETFFSLGPLDGRLGAEGHQLSPRRDASARR